MLEIDVELEVSFDEDRNRFKVEKFQRVCLEHSLVSLSKWESIWKIPFLNRKEKTPEQMLSYLKLMIVGEQPPPEVWQELLEKHIGKIEAYIADEMTATKIFTDPNAPQSRETITAELIYYWMISMNIPHEFENWHINRLITLIRVFNLKNTKQKKMSLADRRALNASRLAQHKTRG